MAVEFEKLKFTRDWNNSADFPTYEENEQKVRADMQALHDETKEFINETLIPSIENMAVPGTGDMKAEVYDPWNKRKDVYQYAEDKIAEHLANDNHVDAYSKEESLGADTRELLGLGGEATPDDALKATVEKVEDVANLPAVVSDEATGKKYTVKTKVENFRTVKTDMLSSVGCTAVIEPTYGNTTMDKPTVFRSGSKALVCASRIESSNYISSVVLADLDSDEPPVRHDVVTNSGSAIRVRFCKTRHFDPTHSMAYYSNNNSSSYPYYGFDTEYGIQFPCGQSSDLSASQFATEHYVGSMYGSSSSTNNRGASYRARGDASAAQTNIKLADANGASYYPEPVKIEGDVIWLLEHSANQQLRLTKVDLATGAVSTGVKFFDLSSIGTSRPYKLTKCITSGNRSYFWLNGGNYCAPRLVWYDADTEELNLNGITDAEITNPGSGYDTVANPLNYVGSTNGKAYFLEKFIATVVDTATGEVSQFSIPFDFSGDYGTGSELEIHFDFKDMPGVIAVRNMLFDTNNGTFHQIEGEKQLSKSSSGFSTYITTPKADVRYSGTVTDCRVMGFYDATTIIGGEPALKVESLVEFTE